MSDRDAALTELQQQFVAMQESFTLLQRDVDDLNEVILSQQRELESLRGENRRLEGRIEQMLESENFPNAAEDKPPHY
ncbi:MAG: SlyX family protein [Planctomycetota bacterium]